MFLALMRKDLRLYRPAIIAAVLLMVLFDGVMPAVSSWNEYARFREIEASFPEMPTARVGYRVLGEFLDAMIPISILLTGFAAIFGGTAVTLERRERWADVPATLPVSRGRRLAATLAAGSLSQAALWTTQAALVSGVALKMQSLTTGDGWTTYGLGHAVIVLSAYSAAMFGTSWALASVLRSPVLVATISAAALFALHHIIADHATPQWGGGLLPRLYYWTFFSDASFRILVSSLFVIAAIGLIVGTVVSMRRVEP